MTKWVSFYVLHNELAGYKLHKYHTTYTINMIDNDVYIFYQDVVLNYHCKMDNKISFYYLNYKFHMEIFQYILIHFFPF